MTRKCHDKAAATCKKCDAEVRAAEKRRQRDYRLDQERQAKQQAYAARLAEIEDEIQHEKTLLKDRTLEQDRKNALAQKKADLQNLKQKARAPPAEAEPSTHEKQQQDSNEPVSPASTSSATAGASESTSSSTNDKEQDPYPDQPGWDESDAKDDWEEQKELWGAENGALDELMQMIGKRYFQHCRYKLMM